MLQFHKSILGDHPTLPVEVKLGGLLLVVTQFILALLQPPQVVHVNWHLLSILKPRLQLLAAFDLVD